VVGINYFTKWVEAKALTTIIEKNVGSFVWKNIICRFRIPRVLVFDNRKQFDNNAFKDFYSELGIKNPTLHLLIHKPMDKLKSRTDPCSKSSRLDLRGQRAYGWRNYQVFYEHTEQQ